MALNILMSTFAGIGSLRSGLHPVQQQLATLHGSQCGFCTPGFVMAMYALLRATNGKPTEQQIADNLAGNLWCVPYSTMACILTRVAGTCPTHECPELEYPLQI